MRNPKRETGPGYGKKRPHKFGDDTYMMLLVMGYRFLSIVLLPLGTLK